MPPVIRWDGSYCELTSAHRGKGVLRIIKCRTKKNGRRESVVEEILIDRSAIQCVYNALKAFADKEREATGDHHEGGSMSRHLSECRVVADPECGICNCVEFRTNPTSRPLTRADVVAMEELILNPVKTYIVLPDRQACVRLDSALSDLIDHDAALRRTIEQRDGQIEKLGTFIIAHVPGEPSKSEGAVDTAIRVMKQQAQEIKRLTRANEILKGCLAEEERLIDQLATAQARIKECAREGGVDE